MAMQKELGQLPEFARTIMDRSLALFHEGRLDGAEVLLATVATQPQLKPFVLHMRGVIAMHLGQKERAREFLTEAIEVNPADAEAHANLGVLLLESRQHSAAVAAYAAALNIDPHNAISHFGLAKGLAAAGLSDLAIDSYRDACALAPDYVDAEIDLGSLLGDIGEDAEAISVLRNALVRHPNRADLHMTLAFCLLAMGDWLEAWREYEWRWSDPKLGEKPLPSDRPLWQGEDLTGKTILLQTEQGFGDTLQFSRYVPMVKARGGRVVLRTPARLIPLMRSLSGVDELLNVEDGAPAYDVHASLLSLPGIFGTRIDTIPSPGPYLAVEPALEEIWRERLGAFAGLSVGLCWQGNPAHAMDRFRSMRLETLRPLLDCSGVRFISLQIGPGQDQLAEFNDRITEPLMATSADTFADAAAIIANLDLVICIDSAIAHLAGALGKPTWIMLAARADWRWLRKSDGTPWYQLTRLFRQKTLGDWEEVVARIGTALRSFAAAAAPIEDMPVGTVSCRQAVDPVLCDALFVEGVRHHRAGDFMRSKKLFEYVLSFEPDHVNALCNLGALDGLLGHHRRALELLEHAVEIEPKFVQARLELAKALLACGNTVEMIVQYRIAIELAPKSDAVHAAFAMALEAIGDHAGAMKHFEQTVKINQRQPPKFYEALGRASLARGNLQGAEISFLHALAMQPELAAAHSGLGHVWLASGRRVDAVASFRRALDIDNDCSSARRGLEQANSMIAS